VTDAIMLVYCFVDDGWSVLFLELSFTVADVFLSIFLLLKKVNFIFLR
jgi:hypothetical protein